MDMVGKAEYKMEQIFTSLNSQSAAGAQREALRPEAEGGAEGEAEGVKREALKARSAAGAKGVKREAPKESKASKQLNNRLFSTGWDGGGSLFS